MKKFLLLLFASILISCSSDDGGSHVDQGHSGLIYSTEHIFHETNHKVFYKYNSDGLVSEVYEDAFGPEYNGVFVYENGKLSKMVSYANNVQNGEIVFQYTGDKITKAISPNYTTTYSYNELGQMVLAINEDGAGFVVEYFENGNVKMKHHLSTGVQSFYEYDNKRNPYFEIYPKAYCDIELIGKNNVNKINSHQIQITYAGDYPVKKIYADGETEIINYN